VLDKQLLNDLKRDEGIRLKPYYDSLGVLTIGVGRNLEMGISKSEAYMLLENDVNRTISGLRRKYDWFDRLSPARKRVIINMSFNMGLKGFSKFKRMIKALEIGHYKRASLEALDSKWADQVGNRAMRIAETIEQGD